MTRTQAWTLLAASIALAGLVACATPAGQDEESPADLASLLFAVVLDTVASEETIARSVTYDPRPLIGGAGPWLPSEQDYLPSRHPQVVARAALIREAGLEVGAAFPIIDDCAGTRSPAEWRTGCPDAVEVRTAFGLPERDSLPDRWVLPVVQIGYSPIGMSVRVRGLRLSRQSRWRVDGVAYESDFH